MNKTKYKTSFGQSEFGWRSLRSSRHKCYGSFLVQLDGFCYFLTNFA